MIRSLSLFCALLGIAVLPCLGVDLDTLQPIGSLAKVDRTSSGINISCSDGSQVSIEVLATDLLHVRASYRQALKPRPNSWAVAKTAWSTPEWQYTEDAKAVHVVTGAVSVDVQRSPLLIAFKDARTHQAWTADYEPMSFDPKGPAIAVKRTFGFEEHFFGLGEKAGGIDKRRGRFTMWNTDAYGYNAGTDPLYQSIPFYIGWQDGSAYGVFYDNSFRSSFDFGSMSEEFTAYTADGGPLDYYFFAGPKMTSIVERYTELTGRIPMPPRWALGNQQSRYTYYPGASVLKIAETYRQHDLPLDVIHLDINYMDGYRDFTWDPKRFPNPKELISSLKQMGVKVVTIVDPGIKYEPGGKNEVFNEGLKYDYFLKNKDGEVYVGKVWPGQAVWVDYTKTDAAKWWGELFKSYVDVGVSGFWADMNEPSDFVDQTGKAEMNVTYFDGGRHTMHAENRNVFALQELKATREGLQALRPNERPYLITRAGSAGVQRYSTMWTGDNQATWESMALSIPMYESLGLSGESFLGADVGGFIGNSNPELLTRWYQIGFLTPFFRNHAEMGAVDHEPWRFGPYYEDIIRKYIKLRYRLLPYLYTQTYEAHRTGLPIFRPLLLNYQDDRNVLSINDEYMIGTELLAAPILKANETHRSVYLPAGTWYDFWTKKQYTGGTRVDVQAALDTTPLFVRAGSIIPMGPEMKWSDEKAVDPLTFAVYPDANGEAVGVLYEDDGSTPDYEKGIYRWQRVAYKNKKITFSSAEGSYKPQHYATKTDVQ